MSYTNGLLEAQRHFLSYIADKKLKVKAEKLFAPENRANVLNEAANISIFYALKVRSGGNVYKNAKAIDTNPFRETWREFLHATAVFYRHRVSEKDHISRIRLIQRLLSETYKDILEQDRMRFGVAQMGLNIYLKYLWCLGEIPPPPHCPASTYKWATLDSSEADYVRCVREYRQKAESDPRTRDALQVGIIQKEDAISFWGLFAYKNREGK